MSSSNGRHRVVIVGSGFGGLAAAKNLRRAPVDVTLIDRTNHHLFQPLLYQLATGIVGAGDIAPPIRDILRRHSNTRVLLGDVVDVDLDAREVTLEAVGRSTQVAYDTLIVPLLQRRVHRRNRVILCGPRRGAQVRHRQSV